MTINDSAGWHHVGRGSHLSFYATNDEVLSWIVTQLPEQYAPYELVGSDLVQRGNRYVEVPFHHPIQDLLEIQHCQEGKRWDFWIRSLLLTPELNLSPGSKNNVICSLNGLINLQHGRIHKGRQEASSIGMVRKVLNDLTGEVVEHSDYLRVFSRLRSHIRSHLRYCTIKRFPNGIEIEDCEVERMTELAAQAYRDGFPFCSGPGRALGTR